MTVEGPETWYRGHTLAINYPDVPTSQDRAQAFIDLWTLVAGLPCDMCRSHATAHVRRYPPSLSNSESYQLWWLQFHNTVNRRLGKPLFSRADYRAKYKNEIRESRSLWEEGG